MIRLPSCSWGFLTTASLGSKPRTSVRAILDIRSEVREQGERPISIGTWNVFQIWPRSNRRWETSWCQSTALRKTSIFPEGIGIYVWMGFDGAWQPVKCCAFQNGCSVQFTSFCVYHSSLGKNLRLVFQIALIASRNPKRGFWGMGPSCLCRVVLDASWDSRKFLVSINIFMLYWEARLLFGYLSRTKSSDQIFIPWMTLHFIFF